MEADTDANRELSVEYAINSIPTIVLVKGGQVLERFVGVRARSEYAAALDAALN